jgi:cell division protease FtsH
MQVPTEDRFLKATELLNKVATLLGGRASEEIVFGDISTGAHNDLAKASDIVRSMVREYGMSKKVGQVYFHAKKGPSSWNQPCWVARVQSHAYDHR